VAEFDVCVIGGGPGGYAAAMRAWDFGKKVCLIERNQLGGVGVHNGALSSKTLWELSRDYRNAIRTDRGYVAHEVELDFAQVVRCVRTAISEKVGQLEHQLEALRKARAGYPGSICYVEGKASFVDSHTVHVACSDNRKSRQITADAIIIATGTRPRLLPNLPVDGKVVITSDHVMDMKRFPRSLVILGAGVVGCEFATVFANFAQTTVYLIDRADRILPFEDADTSRVCSRNLEAKGVTVHHQCQLLDMQVVDGEVEYTIQHHTGGREKIRVEKALIAIGRVPNTNNLNLEKAGVTLDSRGHIEDVSTQTVVPHIFAVGDVTLDVALVSVAEIEGRHAIERLYGGKTESLNYDNLATIMFLDPEVAAIGMNEQQAQKAKIPYKVAVYGYELVNRAIAMRATDGFVKLLVTDDDEMKILGLRALGVHASTVIEAVSLMICQSRSIRDLAELFHPHPAIPEGLQDCVRMLLGTSIYKPHVFNSELRLSHVTYDGDPKK
jgi:dihydrolipoamide dehydrogenase